VAGTASKTVSTAPLDEADGLFDQLGTDGVKATSTEEDLFAGVDDLLDTVEEDDSEGWVPKEKGEGIAGVVVKISQTRSDFAKDGEDPMCPTVTLECKDPENSGKTIKYRVIGYGSVLKRELQEQNPQVGDLMAVKYWGEKILKTGKFQGRPYKHFGIVVRHKS
jgi:hypothetical protein